MDLQGGEVGSGQMGDREKRLKQNGCFWRPGEASEEDEDDGQHCAASPNRPTVEHKQLMDVVQLVPSKL